MIESSDTRTSRGVQQSSIARRAATSLGGRGAASSALISLCDAPVGTRCQSFCVPKQLRLIVGKSLLLNCKYRKNTLSETTDG